MKRKTARDRFNRSLKRVADWCRQNRHQPIREQWQALARKLRGHFGYFGITGNYEAIQRYREGVRRIWRKWLGRRSNRARMPWDRMGKLLERYPLPPPRIARPYCSAQ